MKNSLLLLLICQASLFAHGHHEEEEFQWSKEKSDIAQIQLEIAGPGVIQNLIQVSGKVSIHPDHLAYVFPKIEGIVGDIRKNIGDTVTQGDVLALIESREIAEAKSTYLTSAKRLSIQKILLQKESSLKGISAGQDYLHAELAYEEAASSHDLALQHLYSLGFSDDEISQIDKETPAMRRFFSLKAPLSGKVLQRNLVLGEQATQATRAFTIANLDTLWVEMHLAQNDVRYLKEGLPVEVTANGKRQSVNVCQFSPSISEETRMATAIAVMKNESEKWAPGEYVSVYIQTNRTPVALAVAREAIQKINGQNYVFVGDHENFVPCVVKVGKMDDKCVEIVSGLEPGASYAACNVFCLKADYQKEEAEHHH